MKEWAGSFVVCITPMKEDQELDEQGLKENIEWYIEMGTAGICCCGSTGEFASLTREERLRVARITVDQVKGRVPVLVGTTAETTRDTIAYTRHAREIGADGALILPSCSCKPSGNEIYEHFRAISEVVDLPIMLYNDPRTNGIDMSDELITKICGLKHVKYVKESSGEIRRVRNLLRLSRGSIRLFCGTDDLALESFLMGASGFLSVCGNIVPDLSQHLFDLVQAGDIPGAKALYERLLPLCELIESSGKFVQVVKAGVGKIGRPAGPCRLPRLPLSQDEEEALESVLRDMGVLSCSVPATSCP